MGDWLWDGMKQGNQISGFYKTLVNRFKSLAWRKCSIWFLLVIRFFNLKKSEYGKKQSSVTDEVFPYICGLIN